MLIGGLWHGAGWTFVVWGAIHGTRARGGAAGGRSVRVTSARADTRLAHLAPAPRHVPRRLPRLGVLPRRHLREREGHARRAVHRWGGPSPLVTSGVLLAIAAGIGSQYFPARVAVRGDGALRPAAGRRAGGRARASALMVTNAMGPRAWHPSSTSGSDGSRSGTPPTLDDGRRDRRPRRAPRTEDGRRALDRGPRARGARCWRSPSARLLNAPGMHKSAFNQQTGREARRRARDHRPARETSAMRCCSTGRASCSRTPSAAATTTRSTPRSCCHRRRPAPPRRRPADRAPPPRRRVARRRPGPGDPARRSAQASRSRRSGSCGSGSQATRS